jgi:hypothetical protein|tara:strand:- start:1609 stop:1785 length:177 start_codon:yes stop_codon:yes gene_type:complete
MVVLFFLSGLGKRQRPVKKWEKLEWDHMVKTTLGTGLVLVCVIPVIAGINELIKLWSS